MTRILAGHFISPVTNGFLSILRLANHKERRLGKFTYESLFTIPQSRGGPRGWWIVEN